MRPMSRRNGPRSRPGSGRSDVDELVEVGDQVFDQTSAAVRDKRSHAGDERPQADGRDDQPALSVPPEGSRRTATERERPFEFGLAQAGGSPKVVDDLHDPTPRDDVPHELGHPAIDLLVRLVVQARAVLPGIGRQARATHPAEYARGTSAPAK